MLFIFAIAVAVVFLVARIVMGRIPAAPNDLGAVIAQMSKDLDTKSKVNSL